MKRKVAALCASLMGNAILATMLFFVATSDQICVTLLGCNSSLSLYIRRDESRRVAHHGVQENPTHAIDELTTLLSLPERSCSETYDESDAYQASAHSVSSWGDGDTHMQDTQGEAQDTLLIGDDDNVLPSSYDQSQKTQTSDAYSIDHTMKTVWHNDFQYDIYPSRESPQCDTSPEAALTQDDAESGPVEATKGIISCDDLPEQERASLMWQLKNTWNPPAGLAQKASCQACIAITLDGQAKEIMIYQSSGVLAFDLAMRAALSRITYPRRVWGCWLVMERGCV